MKRSILAFILLLCLSLLLIACTDPLPNLGEGPTNEVVTDEEGSIVTDENGDPETYAPEETTKEDDTAGGINNAGANTEGGFGEFIPVG